MRRPLAVLIGGLGLGLAVGLPLGGAVLVNRADPSPLLADAAPEPIIAAPEKVRRDASFSVGLTSMKASPIEGVISRAGTLTSWEVDAQSPVRDGQMVATVDYQPVVAMVAPTPVISDLRPGDTGPTVRALQEWLVGAGHEVSVTGDFDEATARALIDWQETHPPLAADGVFRLADVMWVGVAETKVDEVLAPPGRAVTPGTPVLRLSAETTRVGVAEPNGLPKGRYALEIGAASVPYEAGNLEVTDPDDAAAITLALYPGTEGTGRLVAEVPTEALVVPASAVVTDASGATCVFTDADSAGVVVEPVGGGLGTVELPTDTALPSVLVNPAAVRGNLSCG